MKVLIVDDIPANLRLLRAVLEAEGIEVVSASDGVEALELLEFDPADAVISDILMPRMDGYRLCHELRKHPRLHVLPFIFYTATYTSPGDEKLCMRLGASGYLKKPASSKAILDALGKALAVPRPDPADPLPHPRELLLMKEYSQQLVIKLEQKNSELQAAHETLRQLLEFSPVVIYRLTSQNGEFVPMLVSDNVTPLLGYSVAEALSLDWWPRNLHPEDRSRVEESIPKLTSEEVFRLEYRLRHKNGDYLWVEDARRLIWDSSGQPSDLVGAWTDLTARRRVEQELGESDRRFRELLENVEMIAITLDTSARLTFCNNYLLRLAGRTREEVIGRDWFDFFIPDDDVELRRLFAERVGSGKFPIHHENPIKTKGGELRHIAWNNTVLRDAGAAVIGIASLGEDVTDRRTHQRLALRSQRLEAIGALAGGVAHDLNNALAPIMMGIDLLKSEYPGESETLDIFQSSAQRGADMVRQLLTFAKGAEGERISIHPARLIEELCGIIRHSFPKNLELLVRCDPKIPTIRGDATQLHQVLLNLCVNARDAMPQGGALTLEARCEELDAARAGSIPDAKPGHYVLLRVSDTGTGIPPEIIDRILEPFFTTKGPDKGTGLGLSTVLGIAKGHGGFLHIESQVGQGSTFAVYLPSDVSQTNAALAGAAGAEFKGGGETVLLVDDEAAVREMGQMVLRRLNFKPLTATDGADGLLRLREQGAGVFAVITDAHMPGMDGLAFVRALRQTLPNIPILVASGRMEDALAAEFKALGVTHRLDKPFTEFQLAEALRKLLTPK